MYLQAGQTWNSIQQHGTVGRIHLVFRPFDAQKCRRIHFEKVPKLLLLPKQQQGYTSKAPSMPGGALRDSQVVRHRATEKSCPIATSQLGFFRGMSFPAFYVSGATQGSTTWSLENILSLDFRWKEVHLLKFVSQFTGASKFGPPDTLLQGQ